MKSTFDQLTKNIPKEDRENPTIAFLLEQFEIILALKEQNQILKDEIARLKNQNPKPKIKIKPSKLPKDPKPNSSPKESSQKKEKKTATLN